MSAATLNNEERMAALEKRVRDLAQQKSRHELLNSMLTRMATVSGLENLTQGILQILMETFGATNILLCYQFESSWKSVDLNGHTSSSPSQQDARIIQALAEKTALRFPGQPVAGGADMIATQDWIFPLHCQNRALGAVVMEQVQLTNEEIFRSLQPFFVYAALLLDNEINNYSKLKESYQTLELYRYALDSASDSLFIVRKDASFKLVNEAAGKSLGYTREQLAKLNVFDIDSEFPRDQWQQHWAELCEKGGLQIETSHRTQEGTIIPVEVSIKIFDFDGETYQLALARDLTERKKFEAERLALERQLLHTQKLESLGVLAGGIAHDFNNLLAAIIGNAELGKLRMEPKSPALNNLERIEQAAERAADLAKQMLAYSGKGKFVVEPLDLNALLEEMLHMLEVSISKKAVLRFNLHRPLPSVEADATQIRQILMNLVINASEAIGDKSGIIAITSGCMDCDESYLHQVWLDENLCPGLYVFLEIADTGCGMNKETLAKLFDPFFTTKFTGRGLGMAAVMGIVRGHQGAIRVYSEVDKGTTFKILLPASSLPAELFNGTSNKTDWQGSGKILLVDDEETVRGIGVEMLNELGFEAITATDGRDALEKFQQHPDICAVVLDLTMPRMDGEQCFRELRRRDPNIKVIMSSGYGEQEVSQKFIGKGLSGFIQKPYKLSILRDLLQKIF